MLTSITAGDRVPLDRTWDSDLGQSSRFASTTMRQNQGPSSLL
jgi:hypothetical protein